MPDKPPLVRLIWATPNGEDLLTYILAGLAAE